MKHLATATLLATLTKTSTAYQEYLDAKAACGLAFAPMIIGTVTMENTRI